MYINREWRLFFQKAMRLFLSRNLLLFVLLSTMTHCSKLGFSTGSNTSEKDNFIRLFQLGSGTSSTKLYLSLKGQLKDAKGKPIAYVVMSQNSTGISTSAAIRAGSDTEKIRCADYSLALGSIQCMKIIKPDNFSKQSSDGCYMMYLGTATNPKATQVAKVKNIQSGQNIQYYYNKKLESGMSRYTVYSCNGEFLTEDSIDDTASGTITDANGNYTLKAEAGRMNSIKVKTPAEDQGEIKIDLSDYTTEEELNAVNEDSTNLPITVSTTLQTSPAPAGVLTENNSSTDGSSSESTATASEPVINIDPTTLVQTAEAETQTTTTVTLPSVAYSKSFFVFTKDSAIATITPTVNGTVTSCSSSPTLPTGLSLDTGTCAISGTPTATQVSTNYTITASNTYGSTIATINVTVNLAPPSALTYSGGPYIFAKGITIATIVPTVNGTVISCMVSPSLPTGLALNTTTCAISGTPTATQSATSYTITASNAYGNTSATINTTIVQAYPIVDTGLNTCYDDSVSITCGSSHLGQDGDYSNIPHTRSYTGPTQHGTYTNDYITTDNTTGLVWKSCEEGKSDPVCATGTATSYNYANAITACANLNIANSNAGYAGRTDWHLPTMQELATLVDYSILDPSIDSGGFPNTTTAIKNWSSTSHVGTPTNAWFQNFSGGFSNNAAQTTATHKVRCVSGSLPVSQSFTDNGDGTIKHNNTGLTWQKCSRGQTNLDCSGGTASTDTWVNALGYCESLTLGGYSDWRLPNLNELKSIIDYSVSAAPYINSSFFPGTVAGNYWSSSTAINVINRTWHVQFSDALVTYTTKTVSINIRCVRGL
ncbi:MAG: DUF1566 domain-containing protein [Leptospiraceae bacterium]|nr:DUF1566 domain-containing protein [Leptospiraceae bacterium]